MLELSHNQRSKKPLQKTGCIIVMFIVLVLVFFVFWEINEPIRRAKRIHKALHTGMNLNDVENLLSGRYYCDYQIMTDSGWKKIQREEFAKLLELGSKNSFPSKRLWLTFLGMAPGRASFFVEMDRTGRVFKITDLYIWD